ncbi:MAG TPA: hypothetical protein PKD68_04505, partial [Candidatus Saccharibacteria bacterium]|nr:hypothetical protein [Candidatus Saccharibacteria bacterium]
MAISTFRSKQPLLPGSSYDEVVAHARKVFNEVRRRTKRQPYVRSKYFKNDKIFLSVFWDHIMQKHQKERRKRLKSRPRRPAGARVHPGPGGA